MLLYFECKFYHQYAFKHFMKIQSENSIRRLSFLYHLLDIKIVWINP